MPSIAAVRALRRIIAASLVTLGGHQSALAQVTPPAAPAPRPRAETVDIVSIGGVGVDGTRAIAHDGVHQQSGLDVALKSDIARDNDERAAWVLVRSVESGTYAVFGPARENHGSLLVSDVRLPDAGVGTRREYQFRAALLPAGERPGTVVTSLDRFAVVQQPVSFVVLRWIPTGLTVDALDGRPLDPSSPLNVDQSGEVAGTRATPRGRFVYLAIHPVDSRAWYLAGPAETAGKNWRFRDVRFAALIRPDSGLVDAFAFESDELEREGLIGGPPFPSKMIAASPTVRIQILPDATPAVTLSRFVTPDGRVQPLATSDRGPFRTKDAELSLSGTATDIPRGHGVWVLVNPVDSPFWIVAGAAVTTQTEWIFPQLRLEAPGRPSTSRFRVAAVVAEGLRVGVVGYDRWSRRSRAISPLVSIDLQRDPRQPGTAPAAETTSPPGDIAIAIARIADVSVGSAHTVRVGGLGAVDIRADGVPTDGQVWLGRAAVDPGSMHFVRAVRVDDSLWRVPAVELGARTMADPIPESELDGADTLTAIVTSTSLQSHDSDAAAWPQYAWAISAPITVLPHRGWGETVTFQIARAARIAGQWWWSAVAGIVLLAIALAGWRMRPNATSPGAAAIAEPAAPHTAHGNRLPGAPAWNGSGPLASLMVLAGLIMMTNYLTVALVLVMLGLVYLARRSRPLIVAARHLGAFADEAVTHIHQKVGDPPPLDAVSTVFGLLLLGFGAVAIAGYFPIYRHVLQKMLGLSSNDGQSLALLLIVFIGLTGVMADATNRYAARNRDLTPALPAAEQSESVNAWAGFLATLIHIVSLTLLVAVAVALLGFQSILYFEFYKTQAAPGSLIPVAFGAAAFFISGIEMVNFYWGSRLSLDFLGWVFKRVVLLGPFVLLAGVARVIDETGQVASAPSADKAAAVAAAYIEGAFGGRYRAGAPQWNEAEQAWLVSLLNRSSEADEGHLRIDPSTYVVTVHLKVSST
jgi:hypothetical protein